MAKGIMISNGGLPMHSNLYVETSESTLQSADVTVEGTNSRTGVVDKQTKTLNNGKAKFRLKYLTDYTVKCGDTIKEVFVDAYKDYLASIFIYTWDGELFDIDDSKPSGEKANQHVDITGGWKAFGTNSGAASYPSIDDLGMHFRGASSVRSGYITENVIDVTGYSKLLVNADNGSGMTIALTKGNISSSNTFGDIEITANLIARKTGDGELSIPEGTTACRVYITSAFDTKVITTDSIKLVK